MSLSKVLQRDRLFQPYPDNETKIATPQQKAFCVLQFENCKSVVTVQRAFRRQFNRDPPNAMPTTSVEGIISSQRPVVCVKAKVWDDQECLRKMISAFRTLSYDVLRSQSGRPVVNFECQ